VAGLVLDRLGRLPEPGDTVQVDGWQLEVLAVEHRAITRLRLIPSGHHKDLSADQQADAE
jgi:putative hemolysin